MRVAYALAMHMLRLICALFALVPCLPQARGELSLPTVFSDHMVLTQRSRASVWGFAEPGEVVRVTPSWNGRTSQVKTGPTGRFDVELETPAAGGPHTITFEATQTIVVKDVMIGEVWLCSGQSNMEMPLGERGKVFRGVTNWKEEVAAANDPLVRFFDVANRPSLRPESTCNGAWTPCTSESAANFSATAYFFGRELSRELGVPIGLITADWSGTPAQAWMSAGALKAHGRFDAETAKLAKLSQIEDPRSPTVLFNGMIAPIVPYAIRGVIWYQGEGNRDRASEYRTLFPALIADWRKQFARSDLSFYFAQIAPFEYPDEDGQTPKIRDAQLATLAIPHTGMVVTMDIGDPEDIHPANKRDVGKRLAALALARDYEREDVVDSGPLFSGVSREGSSLRVHFDHAEGGLVARRAPLAGFEIAGSDGAFAPATARVDGESVIVERVDVSEPLWVRYLWDDAAVSTLANRAGLPASPFLGTLAPIEIEPGAEPLFNGRDLGGWINVNGDERTWSVREDLIHCSGFPTGVLCTKRRFENFVLDVEWRHLEAKGNAGIFVWSDPLPARGQPFTRSVEVQVLDGQEGDWFTSDGDVFPIHGATMTPENGRGGSRAFPTEKRVRAAPEWNHYRITCDRGAISLAVNGKVVTRGTNASPREGHICLESEGSPVEFRNLWIRELPPSSPPLDDAARAHTRVSWKNLYNGIDLEGWTFIGDDRRAWRADDWILKAVTAGSPLWTDTLFTDVVLSLDWRVAPGGADVRASEGEVGAVLLRGGAVSVLLVAKPSKEAADRGGWSRIEISLRGSDLLVLDDGVSRTGLATAAVSRYARAIGITAKIPLEFANIYVRDPAR